MTSAITMLLQNACPSIQYRLRLEILHDSPLSSEMLALQAQILQDGLVQEVLDWQEPDGWLAWDFHGERSLESGVRILCEKGVETAHPVIVAALRALELHPERLECGLGKVGRILDDLGLGGAETIRAMVLAYAGRTGHPFVEEQVGQALAAFRAVLAIESLEDLLEAHWGKWVLKKGRRWPCIYHLRLLALTHAWRTPQNLGLLAESLRRLIQLSPVPPFNVRSGSQLIAPASFCMHDFNPDFASLDGAGWMMAFHRLELLARLGVLPRLPALAARVGTLQEMLAAGSGLFPQPLSHPYFRRWGAYTGLALEPDWKSPLRRAYDLTFRSLLIEHYTVNG